MSHKQLIENLLGSREWRVKSLETYKSFPHRYSNRLFPKVSSTYFIMCIPMIYAHWEGFTKDVFNELSDFINQQKLSYGEVVEELEIISFNDQFKYIQGKNVKKQREKFFREFTNKYQHPFYVKREDAKNTRSNLNFQQLTKMFLSFGIPLSPELKKHKNAIDKLVHYRCHFAHGENAIVVNEEDMIDLTNVVIESMDEIILIVDEYLTNQKYLKKCI